MLLLDPKTLSFVVGLGNLAFALLATVYVRQAHVTSRSLEVWRWGRFLAASGFLSNLASATWPGLVPMVLGNLLHTLAVAMDIAAYCLLLERREWQRPLAILLGAALLIQLAIAVANGGHSLALLALSVCGVMFYGALATLMFRVSVQNWLIKLIATVDSLMALILLIRVVKGLAYGPLIRFDSDVLTILLYLAVYLVVIVNGFGFLLLAKQQDDQALRRALDELAQVDEQRHDFLAQVSHEFRTPAALIKASLDSLCLIENEVSPAVRLRLDNIRRATQRLIDLSNTLLSHDRVSREALLYQPKSLDLVAELREALQLYPADVRLCADLPSHAVPLVADAAQLRIAVQNLIDNALEHNPPTCEPVRVFLQSATDFIEICVADQGDGLDEKDKTQVFTRFRSRHGTFTRGVGLSIVQRIAVSHGGKAFARNNTPRGTVMVLQIPLDF